MLTFFFVKLSKKLLKVEFVNILDMLWLNLKKDTCSSSVIYLPRVVRFQAFSITLGDKIKPRPLPCEFFEYKFKKNIHNNVVTL